MAKEIELQNGMKAIVDDEDFERVNQYNWTVTSKGTTLNVVRNTSQKTTSLTHFILEINDSKQKIIHKNKQPLDFRKTNLISVKQEHISQSRKGMRNSSSKYKGVSWDKGKNKWRASIRVNGKLIYLGSSDSEDEVGRLYNIASLKYFGEHAYQNIIGKDNSANTSAIEKSNNPRTRKHSKTSKYRGVYFDNVGWIAQVQGEYIGWYKTEIEAGKAYNEKAKELFSDKAILNDIPTNQQTNEEIAK